QGFEDERPDHAEGVRFAEGVNVAHAGDDSQQLQDANDIDQAVCGAEAFLRMEEPRGENPVFSEAIEDAVGADDAGVDSAAEDEKADEDNERLERELRP